MSIFKKKVRFKCPECGKLLSDTEVDSHAKGHEEERRASAGMADLAEVVNKRLTLVNRLTDVLAELPRATSARQAYALISESLDCVTDEVWRGVLYPVDSVGLAQTLKSSINIKQLFEKRINAELKVDLCGTVELKWKVPSFIELELKDTPRMSAVPGEPDSLDLVARQFKSTIPLTTDYTGAVRFTASNTIYSDLDISLEETQAALNAVTPTIREAQAKLRKLDKEVMLLGTRSSFLKAEVSRLEAEISKLHAMTERAGKEQIAIFQEANRELIANSVEKLYTP